MDALIKAVGAAVIGGAVCMTIKKSSPEAALAVSTAVCIYMLYLVLGMLSGVAAYVEGLAERAGITDAVISAVLKTVGIAVVSRAAADVCRDSGQAAGASAAELLGASAALVTALPLIASVLEMIGGFV